MKRLYVLLLIAAVLISVSAVSANENLTFPDNQLGIEESGADLTEANEDQKLSDVASYVSLVKSSDSNQSYVGSAN